jgi:hypothetical protein
MVRKFVCLAIFAVIDAHGQITGLITGSVFAEGGRQSLRAGITVVAGGAGVRLRSIEVDDRGAFSIEAPSGPAVIVARADGYASEQREVVVRPGRANPTLNFSLRRAGPVSGRVVDPNGVGIAGARVWVQYPGEARGWRPAEEIGGEPTDALGNFTIAAVAQGRPFLLLAESDDWMLSSSQTMMVRTSELHGVLLLLSRRGASVTGRVLDRGGRPVAGVSVQLRAIPAENEMTADQRNSIAFSRAMHRSAISGEDGSYSFHGLPAGRTVITVQQQGRRSASEAETVSGRATNVDVSLQ